MFLIESQFFFSQSYCFKTLQIFDRYLYETTYCAKASLASFKDLFATAAIMNKFFVGNIPPIWGTACKAIVYCPWVMSIGVVLYNYSKLRHKVTFEYFRKIKKKIINLMLCKLANLSARSFTDTNVSLCPVLVHF